MKVEQRLFATEKLGNDVCLMMLSVKRQSEKILEQMDVYSVHELQWNSKQLVYLLFHRKWLFLLMERLNINLSGDLTVIKS